MRSLAIAAAFALLGTGAVAQSTMSDNRPTMERTTTTVRTHTTMGSTHHRMAAKAMRHCKTWWKHGRKMRTCRTTRHHW